MSNHTLSALREGVATGILMYLDWQLAQIHLDPKCVDRSKAIREVLKHHGWNESSIEEAVLQVMGGT